MKVIKLNTQILTEREKDKIWNEIKKKLDTCQICSRHIEEEAHYCEAYECPHRNAPPED